MKFREAVDFINSYTKSGAPVTDLSRFASLAAELGNPQNKLKFVHVAGTNGKGSICEYISLGLRKSGFKTGCFTSPYIVCLEERIRLDGKNIPQSRLAEVCGRVARAAEMCGRNDFSQFEIFTACAFVYYAEEECDYVVLETGIGGTLDCTNIVNPALCVIGTLDLDHCAILGNTVAEISAHKAGIMKTGVPCVLSAGQSREAEDVFRRRSQKLRSRLVIPEKCEIVSSSLDGNTFIYKGTEYTTTMCGEYQAGNAASAIEALTLLNVPAKIIQQAVAEAVVPARLQRVSSEPVFVIDGGHNPSGFSSAMEAVLRENRSVTLLTGCLKSKSLAESYRKYLPRVKNVVFADYFFPDCVPCAELAEIAEECGVPYETACSSPEAAERACALCGEGGIILAAGSLYLAGDLLRNVGFGKL